MRLLFMADLPRDPNAGAAGTEVRLVEALARQGHEVEEIWSDALPHRIAHYNLHYLLELPRAYRDALARRGDFDVFHVDQPHGWLAAKWARRHRRGVFVHRSHGFEPYVDEVLAPWQTRFHADARSAPRRLASLAMSKLLIERHARLIARWAHGHIVSASGDRDYLVERMGVAPERVAVIPQAPPDEYVATPAPPMTAERMRRVLYVGQFAFVKAPMIVAEAMRRLRDRECTWVCARKDHDAVRALAGPNVTLLDWMPAAQLRDVYDAHGVFLFPSFYEGFGKAFLEAMSRGLCVVATRTGGMPDVIEHGVDGMLVDAGDVDAIVDAVQTLRIDMSAAAAAKARQYSWDRVARECVAFYQAVRR